MLGIKVDGGTQAGIRVPKLLPEWYCLCPARPEADISGFRRLNPGDRYSCPDCGSRRPEGE